MSELLIDDHSNQQSLAGLESQLKHRGAENERLAADLQQVLKRRDDEASASTASLAHERDELRAKLQHSLAEFERLKVRRSA